MKKLLAFLMCAILVCSCFAFTACKKDEDKEDVTTIIEDVTDENGNLKTLGGKTPEQLYADASTLLKNATNFTLTAVQDIRIDMDGEIIEVKQTVVQEVDGDNSHYKTSSDMEGTESEGWYVDGVIYAEMSGVKAKATISKKDYYEKFLGSSEEENKILDIPESWFSDIVIKQEGEEYYIQFSVSGEEYSKLLNKADLEATIKGNVDYKVYFSKDGKILRMESDFAMDVMGATATTHTESIFTEVGTTKKVTAPADGDSYTDVTDQFNAKID